MDTVLNILAKTVRSWMLVPANVINKISRGHVTPDHITILSVLGHFAIFIVLTLDNYPAPRLAALLLVIFGLMDSLDGALARIQHTASARGMFHDAVSDRMKEVILYIALASFISVHPDYNQRDIVLAVVALGTSMLVSYTKAKGEMAIASLKYSEPQTLNRLFSDGIARYEVRMFLIVIGLLFPILPQILWVIILLTTITTITRFLKISRYIKKQEKRDV